MIKRVEEWIELGKKNKKYYFFYQDRALDLTCFLNIHPGGKKALINYVYKDITQILFSVYPHRRDRTLQILFEYSAGRIPPEDIKKKAKIERSVTPERKGKKKVSFQKNFINKKQEKDKQQTDITSIIMQTKQNKKPTQELDQLKKNQNSKNNSKSKQKSKSKAISKLPIKQASNNSISSDIDEHKPVFKVPILLIKNMNSL